MHFRINFISLSNEYIGVYCHGMCIQQRKVTGCLYRKFVRNATLLCDVNAYQDSIEMDTEQAFKYIDSIPKAKAILK